MTGSRITANGFQQPTPVTVVGDAEIARFAPVTISGYLNTLPAFGNATSSRNPAINVAGGGVEFVNLRNLGVTRTLVLLDNRRTVEATTGGGVDTVTLPAGLIKRVEVVTGGASAAWGSDAVAGVVNFVLNHDYEGLGVNVEGGLSQQGDAGYAKLNVTGGTKFAGGRGRFIGEFDYANTPDGVDLKDRSFFKARAVVNNPTYTPTNGQPRQITISGAGTALISPGGVITSGPLRGTQFLGATGSPAPYNFGTQSGALQYGGDVDNSVGQNRAITTALNYANTFAHVDYDLTPRVTAYAEASFGTSEYVENGYLYYYRQGNLPISADNAFLDPGVRQQLLSLGQTGFNLGKDNTDAGPPTSYNKRDVFRGVIGLNGQLGQTWKWHAYYTHGDVTARLKAQNDTIVPNYNLAVDAVRSPITGQIVCRSTLTNPGNGCVPLNVFGTGVASAAALAYTHGTAYQRSNVQLDVVSADATGTLFHLPAGDVSVAVGADYYKNQASATQDNLALNRQFAVQNFQPFSGERDVKEGFIETVVPLITDTPLFKRFEFNAAARVTDYSTSGSGSVVTWKGGLSNQVNDELRLRTTLSHDIRAPTLVELFSGGVLTQQSVFDPLTQRSYAQFTNSRGNPNLAPEEADTLTAGLIYSPRFIPGLSLSIDYYRIKVKGAIAAVSAPLELQYCVGGQTFYCQYIKRDPTTQAILSIDTVPVNIASQLTQGWDFEVDYRHSVGPGSLFVRALANYVPVFTTIDAAGITTKAAGSVGDLIPGEPKMRANVIATYSQGPFSITGNFHYVGAGKLLNAWTTGIDVDNNSVSDFYTFDLVGQYGFKIGRRALQLTVGISNIFDKDPVDLPVLPGTVQGGTAPGTGGRFDLYDPFGRTYRIGLRAQF